MNTKTKDFILIIMLSLVALSSFCIIDNYLTTPDSQQQTVTTNNDEEKISYL